ncbi:hypothetical protein ASF58_23000 [Methylobacterium sp. Leaf125]|uniref:hypothetical protein n=1 Tax=Methylobacterium sp. Leaf125 TaxID=1736265 RepID=UPI0007014BEB|nr:hypothetical protein [Methylobacterium sp. Leaf125]KQQ39163.1 hypothetical protein ASF58_23000 [Methylobacterium sp. Leaf125]
MVEDGFGFLVHRSDEKIGKKPFEGFDDALDFMSWCTANRRTAEPLFSLPIHYRGGRCWVITPGDEDVAFLLKLRWL